VKEELPDIERGDGDFSSRGKEDLWLLLQKNEQDFQDPDDQIEGVSREIHYPVSILSVQCCLLFVSEKKDGIALEGLQQLEDFYQMATRRADQSNLLSFFHCNSDTGLQTLDTRLFYIGN